MDTNLSIGVGLSAASNNNNNNAAKFPTVGLKSLLQNSDLLEILLKPMSKDSSDEEASSSTGNSHMNELKDLDTLKDLDDLIQEPKSKSLLDWEKTSPEYAEAKAKSMSGEGSPTYGNAFLGPNLWDKNDLFQGGVKFEHLELDEFLNENGISETDVEFLDHIQKIGGGDVVVAASSNQSQPMAPTTSSANPNKQPHSENFSSPITVNTNLVAVSASEQHIIASNTSSPLSSMTPPHTYSMAQQQQQPISLEPTIAKSNQLTSAAVEKATGSKATSNTFAAAFNKSRGRDLEKETIGNYSSSSKKSANSIMDENELSFNSNDMSMSSFNDSDDFDPKTRKFSDDDLRPQPVYRKSKKQFVPDELKDDKYWARRSKNNIAAKRSRDARRMKENQIAIRASYLERENDALRKQLDEFKRETKTLKTRISKYEAVYPDLKHLDE